MKKTFKEINKNGLLFTYHNGFLIQCYCGDDYDKIGFKSEKQFEQLTGKNIDTFDFQDFMGIKENYFGNKEIDSQSNMNYFDNISYNFRNWNEPIQIEIIEQNPNIT